MLRKVINLKEGLKLTCGGASPVGRGEGSRRARQRGRTPGRVGEGRGGAVGAGRGGDESQQAGRSRRTR